MAERSWYGNPEITRESGERSSCVKAGIPSSERVSQSSRSGNLVTGRFLAFSSSIATVPPKGLVCLCLDTNCHDATVFCLESEIMTMCATISEWQNRFMLRDTAADNGATGGLVRIQKLKQLCWHARLTLLHPKPSKLKCASTFFPMLQLAAGRHGIRFPIAEGSDWMSREASDLKWSNCAHRLQQRLR